MDMIPAVNKNLQIQAQMMIIRFLVLSFSTVFFNTQHYPLADKSLFWYFKTLQLSIYQMYPLADICVLWFSVYFKSFYIHVCFCPSADVSILLKTGGFQVTMYFFGEIQCFYSHGFSKAQYRFLETAKKL